MVTADRLHGARPRRVLVLGGTGTIGRATVRALVSRGHEVVCLVRPSAAVGDPVRGVDGVLALSGATVRFGDVTDPSSLARDGFRGEPFDVLVSCLASRTGSPDDAWAIDYGAHVSALHASKAAGVTQMILLSAICVQKPVLAFQHAKLAFEEMLAASGLDYTIVRPTAYFKSLSGQVGRLKRGKPFLVFGDGTRTACKPISDDDLGNFLAECVDNEARRNRVLPIGGPGEAITPKEQGERLFALLGREPRFTHVPGPAAGCDRGCPGDAREGGSGASGQGRTRAHRTLLRHGVHARPGCDDREVRFERNPFHGFRNLARPLCTPGPRRGCRRARRPLRVLTFEERRAQADFENIRYGLQQVGSEPSSRCSLCAHKPNLGSSRVSEKLR
jgi:divinyl chlorophyllide a 8-vinyl-reductase